MPDRFRGRIPVSLAAITGNAADVEAARDRCDLLRLAHARIDLDHAPSATRRAPTRRRARNPRGGERVPHRARPHREAGGVHGPHHNPAAEAGWAPDWDELTPAQRNRATLEALPYLRATRRLAATPITQESNHA